MGEQLQNVSVSLSIIKLTWKFLQTDRNESYLFSAIHIHSLDLASAAYGFEYLSRRTTHFHWNFSDFRELQICNFDRHKTYIQWMFLYNMSSGIKEAASIAQWNMHIATSGAISNDFSRTEHDEYMHGSLVMLNSVYMLHVVVTYWHGTWILLWCR